MHGCDLNFHEYFNIELLNELTLNEMINHEFIDIAKERKKSWLGHIINQAIGVIVLFLLCSAPFSKVIFRDVAVLKF